MKGSCVVVAIKHNSWWAVILSIAISFTIYGIFQKRTPTGREYRKLGFGELNPCGSDWQASRISELWAYTLPFRMMRTLGYVGIALLAADQYVGWFLLGFSIYWLWQSGVVKLAHLTNDAELSKLVGMTDSERDKFLKV